MTTATMLYGSPTTHTITLASLASDTNLIAGRQGTVINNGSAGEDAIDAASEYWVQNIKSQYSDSQLSTALFMVCG